MANGRNLLNVQIIHHMKNIQKKIRINLNGMATQKARVPMIHHRTRPEKCCKN